jgi:Tfp pilus assembly protein PilV
VKSNGSSQSDHGIGLIEVIVAMFLLAIASLALLPAIANAVTSSATNQRIAVASDIANAEIDDVRVSTSRGTTCAALGGFNKPDQAVAASPGYRKQVTVNCAAVIGTVTMAKVAVFVRYGSATASPLATVTTLVALE